MIAKVSGVDRRTADAVHISHLFLNMIFLLCLLIFAKEMRDMPNQFWKLNFIIMEIEFYNYKDINSVGCMFMFSTQNSMPFIIRSKREMASFVQYAEKLILNRQGKEKQ